MTHAAQSADSRAGCEAEGKNPCPATEAQLTDDAPTESAWGPVAPYPVLDGTQPCLEVDPDLFFPEVGEGGSLITQTVALCRVCPFISECLAYALTHDVSGIWGGTTRLRRKQLRREYGIRARYVSADPFIPSRGQASA